MKKSLTGIRKLTAPGGCALTLPFLDNAGGILRTTSLPKVPAGGGNRFAGRGGTGGGVIFLTGQPPLPLWLSFGIEMVLDDVFSSVQACSSS